MELKAACLRIGAKQCIVLDREDIRDNPKIWWDQEIVQTIVKSWVSKWSADAVRHKWVHDAFRNSHILQVITFDLGGVSGHINHRAVSAAIV